MILESHFSPSELIQRWDDRTSPSRFAGNDSILDDIYIAHRNNNRIFLIRKGRGTLDPFTTVFRGKILASSTGSMVKGYFGKRVFDYLVVAFFLYLDIYFSYRGYLIDKFSVSTAVICSIVAIVLIMLAIPLPSVRKQYTSFIKEITD